MLSPDRASAAVGLNLILRNTFLSSMCINYVSMYLCGSEKCYFSKINKYENNFLSSTSTSFDLMAG